MIFGLIGSVCTGKKTLAKFLKDNFNFRTFDIQSHFYSTLPASASSLSAEEKFKLFYSSVFLGEW